VAEHVGFWPLFLLANVGPVAEQPQLPGLSSAIRADHGGSVFRMLPAVRVGRSSAGAARWLWRRAVTG
jgi:hypothetical protein